MANQATRSKKAAGCGKSAKGSRKSEIVKSKPISRRSFFEDEVRHLLLAPVMYYGGLSELDMVETEEAGRILYH